MRFGQVNVFCAMCGQGFKLNQPTPPYTRYHTREWGHLCSKDCYEKAELKYARMILGKDDEDPIPITQIRRQFIK